MTAGLFKLTHRLTLAGVAVVVLTAPARTTSTSRRRSAPTQSCRSRSST